MINKNKVYQNILSLYIISLLFSSMLMINVGFAIKPYMIVTIIALMVMILFKERKICRLNNYDFTYLLFLLICSLGILYNQSKLNTLRYILGMIVLFIGYIIMSTLIRNVQKEKIINIINKSGYIFCIITLLYYLYGLININFNYGGNGITSYGVIIDRNMARLVSPASFDPNITAFTFTIFLFFYSYDLKKVSNKIGMFLCILIIILTFSRGALIAFIIGLIINFLLKKEINIGKKIKSFFIALAIIMLVLLIDRLVLNSEIYNTTVNRILNSISDGGSGRISLWKTSLDEFNKKPILGIGLNNTRLFSNGVYTHNTFLQILTETGIVGTIVYSMYLFSIGKICVNIYKKNNRYRIFLSLYICMLIQMFFLSIFLQEMFFLFLILLHYFNEKTPENKES